MIELALPSLADRLDDILPLARRFITMHAQDRAVELDTSAERALLDYEWPGNARELGNRIQRALLVAHSAGSMSADLGLPSASEPAPRSRERQTAGAPSTSSVPPPRARDMQHDPEHAQIEDALQRAQGVVPRAAAELGLSRQALYRRMERLDMVVERRIRGSE